MSPDVDAAPRLRSVVRRRADYGIPVTVVGTSHRKVRVRFGYADESDHVRYPFGRDTRIEGGRGSPRRPARDRRRPRHLPALRDLRHPARDGRWRAGSGATWSLHSNGLRPDGWTSADAAGLPILPGLLRWREVRDRQVDHAIRFTTDVTYRWHLWPARHDAGSATATTYPPMGARFRLKADVPRPRAAARTPARWSRAMKTLRPGAGRQRLALVLPGRAQRGAGRTG